MKKSTVILLLLVICLFISDVTSRRFVRDTKASKGTDNKIVGGYNITIKDAPSQVAIEFNYGPFSYRCGGSILSDKYILTAAHCLVGLDYVTVVLSSEDITERTEEYNATAFTIHPSFDAETLDYDVGLIKIRRGLITNETTKFMNIVDEDTVLQTGSIVRVTGWGFTSEDAKEGSRYLMAVDIPIVDQDECKQSYDTLTSHQFCAGEVDKGACEGDAGGPAVLVESGLQVGITSHGNGCARSGYPGVFTNIADPDVHSFIVNYT